MGEIRAEDWPFADWQDVEHGYAVGCVLCGRCDLKPEDGSRCHCDGWQEVDGRHICPACMARLVPQSAAVS